MVLYLVPYQYRVTTPSQYGGTSSRSPPHLLFQKRMNIKTFSYQVGIPGTQYQQYFATSSYLVSVIVRGTTSSTRFVPDSGSLRLAIFCFVHQLLQRYYSSRLLRLPAKEAHPFCSTMVLLVGSTGSREILIASLPALMTLNDSSAFQRWRKLGDTVSVVRCFSS